MRARDASQAVNMSLFENDPMAPEPLPLPAPISDPIATRDRPLTAEMHNCLEMALSGSPLKISAYAGAAKTSTLEVIARAKPTRERGIYLAFNKAIATEAAGRFPRGVQCSTVHSVAFRASPKALTQKLNLPRIFSSILVGMYRLQPMPVRTCFNEPAVLDRNTVADILQGTISRFCGSCDVSINETHVDGIDYLDDVSRQAVVAAMIPLAQAHWGAILNPSSGISITHDTYVKAWSLSRPQIQSSYILFDEAQDADPVMLGVLAAQGAQTIFVGDPYQQIYRWRGAVNALASIKSPEAYLTQSFRFGEILAELGNRLLRLLDATRPLLGTPAIATAVEWSNDHADGAAVDAILCRTNANGVAEASDAHQAGLRVHLQINTQEVLAFCDAVESLRAGISPRHANLSLFSSYEQLVDFAETKSGREFLPYVKLIARYGIATIRAVIAQSVPRELAQVTVSTAHKAKGLEWRRVRLSGDFRFGGRDTNGVYRLDPDEVRLVYVAATRAQHYLDASAIQRPLLEAESEKELAP